MNDGPQIIENPAPQPLAEVPDLAANPEPLALPAEVPAAPTPEPEPLPAAPPVHELAGFHWSGSAEDLTTPPDWQDLSGGK